MIRTHGKKSLAAIGGLTAAVVVLAGLPSARADELADLRANQQLLQQRIDQLAQAQAQMAPLGAPGTTGGAAYGTHAVPGAALLGGSFPRSFLIPGTDTSIRVGGFASEILDYWFQNGQENGVQNTTLGDNGQVLSQPLDITGQKVPGYPTAGNVVPANPAHSRGNGIFQQSPRESRLNVETRTPTAYGEARTFVEFDFAGTNAFSQGGNGQVSVADNLIPRLRYAYGTLGGVLAGQANSNFSDPDAGPETIDFGGNVGEAGVVRIPQVRYTYAGPYGSAWSASIETPQTDVITPAGKIASDGSAQVVSPTSSLVFASNSVGGATNCVANGVTVLTGAAQCTLSGNPALSKAPDITFASYWSQPWGHVDFKLVGRDLTINDGKFVDRSFFGYGGGISGDAKPGWFGWGKDDFTWQFTIGTGIGRYLNESDDAGLVTNYLVTPATAAAAGLVIVKPIQEFGGDTGYQHWWLDNLRSTASFGYAHQEINSQLIGPIQSTVSNKQVMTAHVNLIWSPVAFVDTGIEYMWGQREVVANIRGTEQALIGMFRVKF
ncbi:MAG TPA: DcaP family trimeric outer membrane transporter [Stellaceae bacterium]|jgi:hypothetical protein|nr:DcaP family trimeric outer membrane transporter [Stellaceae bacterium]